MEDGLVSASEPEGRLYDRGRKLHRVTEKHQSHIGHASGAGSVRGSMSDMEIYRQTNR